MPPHTFFVGDRVSASLNWPALSTDEEGTIVQSERIGASVVYTVAFDSGPKIRCFGFMLHRLSSPNERLGDLAN